MGVHTFTLLYPKPCYNELCYKEGTVHYFSCCNAVVVKQSDQCLYCLPTQNHCKL